MEVFEYFVGIYILGSSDNISHFDDFNIVKKIDSKRAFVN